MNMCRKKHLRILLSLLGSAAVSLSLSAAAENLPKAEEQQKEDLPKAEELPKEDLPKLDMQKFDPALHLKQAMALIKEKRYQEAQKQLDTTLELNPNYYDAWGQQALLYVLTGKDDKAIDKYKQLVEVKPELVDAHVNLGSLLSKKNQLKDAEWELRKAIAINYRSIEGYYNLANVLVRQNRYEEALTQYKMCLKLSPNNAKVYNNMGVIYQNRDYLEEAHEAFLHALALDPANEMFEKNLTLLRQQIRGKTYQARHSSPYAQTRAVSATKSVTK